MVRVWDVGSAESEKDVVEGHMGIGGCVGMPRKKYSQAQLKKWSGSRFPHFELCTHTDKRQWNFTCLSFRVSCNWFSEQITIMALTMLNLVEIKRVSYCESAPRKKFRFVLISSEVYIWSGDGSSLPSLPPLREEGKRTFLSSSALAMNLFEMYCKWAPVEQPLKMKVVFEQIIVVVLVRWLICSKLKEPLKETPGSESALVDPPTKLGGTKTFLLSLESEIKDIFSSGSQNTLKSSSRTQVGLPHSSCAHQQSSIETFLCLLQNRLLDASGLGTTHHRPYDA